MIGYLSEVDDNLLDDTDGSDEPEDDIEEDDGSGHPVDDLGTSNDLDSGMSATLE